MNGSRVSPTPGAASACVSAADQGRPSLALCALGGFRLETGDGSPLHVRSNKARALLGYLAFGPSPSCSRERLAALLWSRSDDERARSSLRQALSQLKRALEAHVQDVLVTGAESVLLVRFSLRSDVEEFAALAAAGDAESLERAVTLYDGDLLKGIYAGGEPFDDWLAAERAAKRGLAAQALLRLGERRLAAADPHGAAAVARRCVSLEPLKEPAYRLLIGSLAAAGHSAEALRAFKDCERLLRRELGVAPERETLVLEREIRDARAAMPPAVEADDAHRLPERPSIAVLPLACMGAGTGLEEFADGLVDDVITALSRIRDLFVIDQHSTFSYEREVIDVKRVGRELGVRYVVEGSVRCSGTRLRLAVRLVDAVNARHIWAETYDRELGDPFEIQDTLTLAIVASVQTQILLDEGRRGTNSSADSATRNRLPRAGRVLYELSAENVTRALKIAEEVLAAEPDNAAALRIVASARYHEGLMGYVTDRAGAFERGLAAARRAVEIEEDNEFAHWLIGNLELWAHKAHDRARVAFERSLEINPNYSLGYASLGNTLIFAGRVDEGIAHIHTALRSNPRDPYNFFCHQAIGLGYFLGERLESAVEWSGRAVHRRPDWYLGQLVLGASLAGLRRFDDARVAVAAGRRYAPASIRDDLGVLPFRSASHLERFAEALASAGW